MSYVWTRMSAIAQANRLFQLAVHSALIQFECFAKQMRQQERNDKKPQIKVPHEFLTPKWQLLVISITIKIWLCFECFSHGFSLMPSKFFEKKMFRGNRSSSRSSLGFCSENHPVPNPVGHLEVEVVEAVNLTAADFGGKSDPYVIMVWHWNPFKNICCIK